MIAIPKPQQRILEALQARINVLQAEIAEIDQAWRETIRPLVPDGERAEDYVIAQNGAGLALQRVVKNETIDSA